MRFRLSLLMFLQYAAPGAFLPLYSLHLEKLGYAPRTVGCFCATQGLASVLCPLVAGHVADRWVSAERCLAACSLLAGVALWLLAGLTEPWAVFAATLAYWLTTVPILLLGTAICFAHLKRPEKDYGSVRLWGTVGWMAQAWLVLAIGACGAGDPSHSCARLLFRVGAVLALALSGYALTLPATPPRPGRFARPAPLAALALLRGRKFAVYSACLFGLCVTYPFMTQGAPLMLKQLAVPDFWVGPALTVAQASEVASLALLPAFLLRLGTRGTMLLGLGAWAAAFGVFALGRPAGLVVGSLGLNGLCIAGYFVAGQVFVNRHVRDDVRASAQSLLTFVNGAGMLVGHVFVGYLRGWFDQDLPPAFAVGAGLAAALLLLFLWGFRERRRHAAAPALSAPATAASA